MLRRALFTIILLLLWPSLSAAQAGKALLGDYKIGEEFTKSELLERFEGTPWFALSRPVGLLEVTFVMNGTMSTTQTFPCTAWLIDREFVLTANHCIPNVPGSLRGLGEWKWVRATVSFDYTSFGTRRVYDVEGVVETNSALDYSILKLRSNPGEQLPGDRYGVVRFPKGTLDNDDAPLYMFHHPYGYYKLILKDPTCRVFSPPTSVPGFLYHQCDTRGGSSGAPVFSMRPGFLVDSPSSSAQIAIGLHTTGLIGGLRVTATDFNTAIDMSTIVASSTLLTTMACELDPDPYEPRYYCEDLDKIRPILVYFEEDSTALAPEYMSIIDLFVKKIKAWPVRGVLVTGYTDTAGSAAYNVGKSQRMAKAVADRLVSAGLDGQILTVNWKGESEPAIRTGDGVSEKLNRRVTIQLVLEGGATQ